MTPRLTVIAALIFGALPAWSNGLDLDAVVNDHILPRYAGLATASAELAATSQDHCAPSDPALRDAYHGAFDAWVSVSHLRFGPSEADDRAFAIAFWPVPRGSTPKALSALLASEDPVIATVEGMDTVSIAARGFYALDYLLFDDHYAAQADGPYGCALIQAVAEDIALNARAILAGWGDGYGALMANPGNDTYRTDQEAAQQLFTALSTGLEFTAQTRLGRPLGTFDRPRPKRAEARRSGRPVRHVRLSLEANRDLAAHLSGGDPTVDAAFAKVLARVSDLDDPVLAQVATPQGRFEVEVLQQQIDMLRQNLAEDIGTKLGIAAGFNSLDGD